jgi:pimeloyl-ACP methyl ester carboxylesterase
MPQEPTIVLVHGAFADGASWAPVTKTLLEQGRNVLVPPVFNRSLSGDSAYIKSFVEQIDGPVLLVGHSYGGAVITVAGVADNVVGLVYVAGYALAEGESLAELQGRFPDSDLAANLVYCPYPIEGEEPGTDVSVKDRRLPRRLCGRRRRRNGEGPRRFPASPLGRGLRRTRHRRRVEDQAGLGHRLQRRPHHQPRGRTVRL